MSTQVFEKYAGGQGRSMTGSVTLNFKVTQNTFKKTLELTVTKDDMGGDVIMHFQGSPEEVKEEARKLDVSLEEEIIELEEGKYPYSIFLKPRCACKANVGTALNDHEIRCNGCHTIYERVAK